MSKYKKLVIGLVAISIIGGGSAFLLKQKSEDVFVEREISIKQAEVEKAETKIYQDTAGFEFEYPGDLTITEIEMDDDQVYSSLEIKDLMGEKINLRISDTNLVDLEAWQSEFEKTNVIIKINEVFWADIDGLQVEFGAPKQLRTVAIDSGVLYSIISPADDGYWDKVHQQIVNGFEFDESVYQETTTEKLEEDSSSDETIELIEEILE